MDGVVVVRPAAAWSDPGSVLFKQVPAVHLVDVAPRQAVERLARELGGTRALEPFPHGRTMSLDQPQGPVLDLVNAIVRAHGEMTWALAPRTGPDATEEGYRYTLTLEVMGGSGVGFPVR